MDRKDVGIALLGGMLGALAARPGTPRVTADSKAGRRMTVAKGTHDIAPVDLNSLPADIRAHNEAIEEKRKADLAARKARREVGLK